MSWFKDNKFLVVLGGTTLVLAIVLFMIGSKGSGRYDQAKQDFDAAVDEATAYERLPLYPRTENRDGKSKALDEYRKATDELQAAFKAYRSEKPANVTPQEFTTQLKAVNDQLVKAFADSNTKLPDEFFRGFERYKTELARSEATGILGQQLQSIKALMLALAKSGPSELRNLHRPGLPEEEGRSFEPKPSQVARPLPLEISFTGPERSARQFLSAISNPDSQYVVIRTLRITNAKKDPPRAADAKFDKPAAASAAPAASDIFGGAFVMPAEGDEGDKDKPAAPPAPKADTSRILAQVLGNEEVQVFVRLDVMSFLPAKKLP
ncbi:MAG TPA: Amuc_1100 family pilus-like protein [Desulfurivibrionaceae bacterium]|nr:Amuc_1100 family pilus-like protein [Desulfurivibrionaceae bacterium]